jgi:tetratricopeptide repeat protein 21B
VVKEDMESAPGLLAMATGMMLLKQSPKAKNILKRLQKMNYSAEDGDDLERGWLMLADVYIHGGKHDAAQV